MDHIDRRMDRGFVPAAKAKTMKYGGRHVSISASIAFFIIVFQFPLVTACAPDPPGFQNPSGVDKNPPYLISMEPSGTHINPNLCLGLTFSEPILESSLNPETGMPGIVLLEGEAPADVVEVVGRGGEAPDGFQMVEARLKTAKAGSAVILCPLKTMKDETEYSLVVTHRITDKSYNPLCSGPDDPSTRDVVIAFKTTFAGLRVTGSMPPPGAVDVPTNLPRLRVTFDRPVDPRSLKESTIRVTATSGQNADLMNVALVQDGKIISAELAGLIGSMEYKVEVDTDIRAMEAGQRLLVPYSYTFTTTEGPDLDPPKIANGPDLDVNDTWADLKFETDEPALCSMDYGLSNLHSNGRSGGYRSESMTQAFDVPIDSLLPESHYFLTVTLEDIVGNQSDPFKMEFTTLPPQGRPVITEVMANPVGPASSEAPLEYVEVYNAGSGPLDLSGWFIDDRGDGNGADLLVPDQAGGSMVILPGKRALLVASSYYGAYDLPEDVLLIRCDDGKIGADGLSQSDSVELYDQDPGNGGELMTSYGGWINASRDGVSVERKSVSKTDIPSSWIFGTLGGTPGKAWPGQDL
ncbi:MAG: hypothetical protein GXP49_10265 [Deltaproteobacteria bacterium]|nr:hypothetical protein [Deltaproteobacteria bacterium]